MRISDGVQTCALPIFSSPGFAGFAMTISSWPLCLLERRGDLQLDRVADHRDAETEAEIAALDRRFGLEADGLAMGHRRGTGDEIGRASCRERVWQYV